MSSHLKTYFYLKKYHKPICAILKKNFFFEFFRTLKRVTKRECVTSRVRKDARGYCKFISQLISRFCFTLMIILEATSKKV